MAFSMSSRRRADWMRAQAAVLHAHDREIDVALDRDRQAQRRDEGDGEHEFAASLEEADDRCIDIHNGSLLYKNG
jgi:hypothetical protein